MRWPCGRNKGSASHQVSKLSSLTFEKYLQELKIICVSEPALQPLIPILISLKATNQDLLIGLTSSTSSSSFVLTMTFTLCLLTPDLPTLAKSDALLNVPPSPLFSKFSVFFSNNKQPHELVPEADYSPMWHIPSLVFQNWVLTMNNNPSDSFVARTVGTESRQVG